MLNNPTFLLVMMLAGSVVFRQLLSQRARNFFVPWVFAYMLWVLLFGTGTGGVSHFFATAFNFVIVMILTNGCNLQDAQRNGVWASFLIFWTYMICAGMFGLFPYASTVSYLTVLIMSFATGFYVAMWVVKTEGALRRLSYAVVWSAVAFSAYSILHGGLSSSALAETGRATLDAATFEGDFAMNANSMPAYVLCYLPFLIVAIMMPTRRPQERTMKYIALCVALIMTLLMVRSGSRVGGLGLGVCGLYFIYSTEDRIKRNKRIILLLVTGFIVGVSIIVTMKSAQRIRAFDMSNQELVKLYGDGFSLDRMSTGRTKIYEKIIKEMSPMQKIFGRGLIRNVYEQGSEVEGKVQGNNDHSSFVSIFVRGGAVGSFLFLIFLCCYIRRGMSLGDRGRLALFLLGVWVAENLGESWGINGGRISVLLGFGIGLLTNQRVGNSELMSDFERRMAFSGDFRYWQ